MVGKTNLYRRALRLIIPGFDQGNIGLREHFLGRGGVEMPGDYQGCGGPAKKRAHSAFLFVLVKITGRQQHLIAVLAESIAKALQGIGKDRPGNVGHHHADDPPARRCQAPGNQIRHVAELGHCRRDFFALLGRHLLGLIEVARDHHRRDPQVRRHTRQGRAPCRTPLAGWPLGVVQSPHSCSSKKA